MFQGHCAENTVRRGKQKIVQLQQKTIRRILKQFQLYQAATQEKDARAFICNRIPCAIPSVPKYKHSLTFPDHI
jgi:hypothetical protein